MTRFKDRAGREWDIGLTLGLVGQLRREAEFDLNKASLSGEALSEALFINSERLGMVLWVLLRGQAEKQSVTRDQFEDAIGPKELDSAVLAFIEAMVDFFHRGRATEIKSRLPAMMEKINRTAGNAVGKALDLLISSDSDGSSLASSASTPAI